MDTRPKSYAKPENLTEFGRYFEATCQIMKVSHRRIARESGIPQPTLWTWVADGKRPNLESLEKLFVACRKHGEWRVEPWERDLSILAGHVTQQQRNEALHDLIELESEVQQNRQTPPDVRT